MITRAHRLKLKHGYLWVNDKLRLVATPLAIVFVVYAFVITTNRGHQEARDRHDAVQQNVRARYDDCQNSNGVRAARRTEIKQSALTTPLLYRLLPALNTPEVRKVVNEQRMQQLRAYHDVNCKTYALEAVPIAARGNYTVPKPRPKAKEVPVVTVPPTPPKTTP